MRVTTSGSLKPSSEGFATPALVSRPVWHAAAPPPGASERSRYWSKGTTRGLLKAIFSEIASSSAWRASDTPPAG